MDADADNHRGFLQRVSSTTERALQAQADEYEEKLAAANVRANAAEASASAAARELAVQTERAASALLLHSFTPSVLYYLISLFPSIPSFRPFLPSFLPYVPSFRPFLPSFLLSFLPSFLPSFLSSFLRLKPGE